MLVAVVGVDCSGSLSRRNSSMRVRIVLKSSAARGCDIKPSGPRITKRGMVSPKPHQDCLRGFLSAGEGRFDRAHHRARIERLARKKTTPSGFPSTD